MNNCLLMRKFKDRRNGSHFIVRIELELNTDMLTLSAYRCIESDNAQEYFIDSIHKIGELHNLMDFIEEEKNNIVKYYHDSKTCKKCFKISQNKDKKYFMFIEKRS